MLLGQRIPTIIRSENTPWYTYMGACSVTANTEMEMYRRHRTESAATNTHPFWRGAQRAGVSALALPLALTLAGTEVYAARTGVYTRTRAVALCGPVGRPSR